jgi:two-component system, cell cycle response regulator
MIETVNAWQLRAILVDADDESREVMMRRLSAQGYVVEATPDPSEGANMALSAPPSVLVADLWMPGISGVQLCRLLRAEPATAEVPVILRGQHDDPRSRFWAERAGAAAYVVKGRMAELVRALSRAVADRKGDDGFFMQLSGGSFDIRDRIASQLDIALFESVIAAEVRALGNHGSFERLFDAFSQFLSQVINYRWLAVCTTQPARFALHHHPHGAAAAESEARAALNVSAAASLVRVADGDAREEAPCAEPVVCPIPFGSSILGSIALAPSAAAAPDTATLLSLVARELGGPLRIAALMEESQRLATVDSLTGLMNRRAFLAMMRVELNRCQRYGMPLSLLLLDIDHFKAINDNHGHAAGDQALVAMGELLQRQMRVPDWPARWGGEEMVIALTNTDSAGGAVAGERLRRAVEALSVPAESTTLRFTVSLGLATLRAHESLEAFIDRADRAMYAAKVGGRNRLVVAEPEGRSESAPQPPAPAGTTSTRAPNGELRGDESRP